MDNTVGVDHKQSWKTDVMVEDNNSGISRTEPAPNSHSMDSLEKLNKVLLDTDNHVNGNTDCTTKVEEHLRMLEFEKLVEDHNLEDSNMPNANRVVECEAVDAPICEDQILAAAKHLYYSEEETSVHVGYLPYSCANRT